MGTLIRIHRFNQFYKLATIKGMYHQATQIKYSVSRPIGYCKVHKGHIDILCKSIRLTFFQKIILQSHSKVILMILADQQ